MTNGSLTKDRMGIGGTGGGQGEIKKKEVFIDFFSPSSAVETRTSTVTYNKRGQNM